MLCAEINREGERKRRDGPSRGNNEIRSVCHSDRNQDEGRQEGKKDGEEQGGCPEARPSKNNRIAPRGVALSRIKFTFQPPLNSSLPLRACTSTRNIFALPPSFLSSFPSPRPPSCRLIFPSFFWNFQKA